LIPWLDLTLLQPHFLGPPTMRSVPLEVSNIKGKVFRIAMRFPDGESIGNGAAV
jgi:hypothetical protein